MLTKLILFIIVINILGSLLKKWQEKKRQQERLAQGLPPETATPQQEPQDEDQSELAKAPSDDLFAALMEKWEEPRPEAREEEQTPVPTQAVTKTEEKSAQQSFESFVEIKESQKQVHQLLIQEEEAPYAFPENLTVQASPNENSNTPSSNPEVLVSASVTNPTEPEGIPLGHKLFARGSLQQAVIYHEILGTPKGMI